MGVQFFFDNAKRKINSDFPNVFGDNRRGSGGGKGRVSTVGLYNKFIKPYGWLNSLYMVAEKGIFRIEGNNDIDIVTHFRISHSFIFSFNILLSNIEKRLGFL